MFQMILLTNTCCVVVFIQTWNSSFVIELAPALRWGLSCAESACVTDFKGRSSLVVLQRTDIAHNPNYGPGFALGPLLCGIGSAKVTAV